MFDLVRHVMELSASKVHTPLDNATGWNKGDIGITDAMGGAHYHTEAVERYNNCTGAGYQTEHWHLDTATGESSICSPDRKRRVYADQFTMRTLDAQVDPR
jgi:hypothetical protein